MSISLRDITEDNFRACVDLKVAEGQEKFVATNVMSIAQSKVYPSLIPLAVYNDEDLVGFTLHGKDTESKKYWIVRLMIDEKFQGKGFGKEATLELIKKMRGYGDCEEIFLSFVPANTGAEKLYEKIGFERTGITDEDGEIEMRMRLEGRQGKEHAEAQRTQRSAG